MKKDEVSAGCICCGKDFPTDSYYDLTPAPPISLCSACRSDAKMGARARGMEYKHASLINSETRSRDKGWNDCLLKIKEGV
jgi:hypothetical protein